MFGLILLLLIVVPIVELYVLVQVADGLGWGVSIALLLAVSVIGSLLMKWQTVGAFGRVTAKIAKGEMPSNELVDAALMIFGAALLLTPGFFTDVVGLAMFIPPLRMIPRRMILSRVTTKVATISSAAGGGFGPGVGFNFGSGFGTGAPGTSSRRGSFIDIDDDDINVNPSTQPVENVRAERIDDHSNQLPPITSSDPDV